MKDQLVRPIRAALLLGTACLALCACAAIPDLGIAPKLKAIAGYAADQSFAAPAADWPQDHWWTAYKDPQLDQLIAEALAGSPDLAQAEARVRQAEASAQQVGATLGPQVGAFASVAEAKQSYNDNIPRSIVTRGWRDSGAVGLDLNWQIDFFGKNHALLAAATSEAEAEAAEASAARIALSTAIAAAYADLASLYADRDAAEDAVRTRSESEGLIRVAVPARTRNQGRMGSRPCGARAIRGRTRCSERSHRHHQERNRGTSWSRARPRPVDHPPAPGAVRPFGLPANLPAELLGRRADVIAARLTAEAEAQKIDAAKADFYPNVNLVALAGFQSIGLNMLTKSGSTFGAAGPAVTLPIFTAGRLQGEYRGARANYDLAVASYDETVTQRCRRSPTAPSARGH